MEVAGLVLDGGLVLAAGLLLPGAGLLVRGAGVLLAGAGLLLVLGAGLLELGAGLVSALSRVADLGRVAHTDVAAAAVCLAPALASVTPTALEEQTPKPMKAPSTISRTSWALTCPASPRLALQLGT